MGYVKKTRQIILFGGNFLKNLKLSIAKIKIQKSWPNCQKYDFDNFFPLNISIFSVKNKSVYGTSKNHMYYVMFKIYL